MFMVPKAHACRQKAYHTQATQKHGQISRKQVLSTSVARWGPAPLLGHVPKRLTFRI
jgi:hypothetical protein